MRAGNDVTTIGPCRRFGVGAHCATTAADELKTQLYDRVSMYRHFIDIKLQQLKDLQIYAGRCCKSLKVVTSCKKLSAKSLLSVLTSSLPISVLMSRYCEW